MPGFSLTLFTLRSNEGGAGGGFLRIMLLKLVGKMGCSGGCIIMMGGSGVFMMGILPFLFFLELRFSFCAALDKKKQEMK